MLSLVFQVLLIDYLFFFLSNLSLVNKNVYVTKYCHSPLSGINCVGCKLNSLMNNFYSPQNGRST